MIALILILAYVAVAIKLLPMLSRKILRSVCGEDDGSIYGPDDCDRGFALFFGILAAALWPATAGAVLLYGYVWPETAEQ